MQILDLIGADGVIPGVQAANKAQLLKVLAAKAAAARGLDAAVILDALNAREAIGATSVGRGIALPHARIAGLRRMFGLFATLEQPIDFEAYDEEPVDLVFLLLSPDNARGHLTALARVARMLGNRYVAERLRLARSHRQLVEILAGQVIPGFPAGLTPSPSPTASRLPTSAPRR